MSTIPCVGGSVLALLFAVPLCAQEGEKPAPRTVPALKLQAMPAQPAQGPSQEELKQRLAEKLAKPVFQKAAWLTDYDAARKQAAADDKLLLVYFTRSYAG